MKSGPPLAAMLSELTERMRDHSFKCHAANRCYGRTYEWGEASIYLHVIPHAHDFDMTANVSVRLEAVEQLVNQACPWLTASQKRQTATMGAEFGNLLGTGQKRWKSTNDDDARHNAALIYNDIVNIALPYIAHYSNLRNALEILRRDDRIAWIHAVPHGARAARAIAVAWLLGDSPTLEEIIRSKLEYVREMDTINLPALEVLIKSLREK